ncbi:MAG: PspA-associated protein PspAB [Acidimicrobiales bacterium]
MGLFNILSGKTKVAAANLDQLFAMSGAMITMEVNANLIPKGRGAVCFKPSSGAAFENATQEFTTVLQSMQHDDGSSYTTQVDDFGYEWIIVNEADTEALVTEIHVINRTLEDHGFGPALLCSAFRFDEKTSSAPVYWIYLYKKGTFYPFVPTGQERRDNEKELTLKAIAASDLPIEPDLSSWMAPWGLPL